MQATNRAMILSAAWRIVEQPNSHISKVLQSKYFPDTSMWRAKSNIPKSGFWASLLKVRHLLQANSVYQILDGNSSVWSTPWFPHWQDIYDHLQIQPGDYVYPSKIKDLWNQNQKTWNASLIYNLFYYEVANSILQVPIIQQEGTDILCWRLHPSGN